MLSPLISASSKVAEFGQFITYSDQNKGWILSVPLEVV